MRQVAFSTAILVSAALAALGTPATLSGAANDAPVLQRQDAALVTLKANAAGRLGSKAGKKFIRVDGFDTTVLSVRAETPTSLILSAVRPGVTQLKVTYEDRQEESLIVWIEGQAAP